MIGDALGNIDVPTLLIVGAEDHVVIDLNKKAFSKLKTRGNHHLIDLLIDRCVVFFQYNWILLTSPLVVIIIIISRFSIK